MVDKSEQPRLSKLIIGTAAGILLTVCIGVSIASGAAVSIPLRIILFLPDQLGLVWKVTPENTMYFIRDGTFRLPQLPKGRYLIYPDQFPPAVVIEIVREADAEPVILTEFSQDVLTVDRYIFGLGPVSFPLYRFQILETGDYLLRLRGNGPGGFTITPDISAHNDWVLIGALTIQPVILGIIIRGIYQRRNRARLATEKIRKGTQREKFDEWMEKYRDGQDS